MVKVYQQGHFVLKVGQALLSHANCFCQLTVYEIEFIL